MDRPGLEAIHDAAVRRAVDGGKLIEAGWIGYRRMVVPALAPQVQIDETRAAFFAGAQHIFGALCGMFEGDEDPTEEDMRRMDQIGAELAFFLVDFKAKHGLGPEVKRT